MIKIFQEMRTAPKDGTWLDLLCKTPDINGSEVIAHNISWGEPLIGDRTKRIWRGQENKLSPYLIPIGWRIRVKEGDPLEQRKAAMRAKK